MKTRIFQNRTSMISIFACVAALFTITLMSSCAKAKVKGALKVMNVTISKCGGEGVEFTTEGKNVVLISKVGPISEERKKDADYRKSMVESVKNDTSLRYMMEDLVPLCKEADYEYFVVRYTDSISGDTMNISVPFEEM